MNRNTLSLESDTSYVRVFGRNIRADVLIEELENQWNAVRKHEMLTHVFKLHITQHLSISLIIIIIFDFCLTLWQQGAGYLLNVDFCMIMHGPVDKLIATQIIHHRVIKYLTIHSYIIIIII